MISRLPYSLSSLASATPEGLEIHLYAEEIFSLLGLNVWENGRERIEPDGLTHYTATWPAAERLRYRKNEPYCYVADGYDDSLVCERAMYDTVARPLHRLAAILCDDAEAFRVLHWCINNLCNTALQGAEDELSRNDHLDTSGG